MKNLSSKIVIALSSLALVGAMYACTNTVVPPDDDETAEKVESSDSEDVDDESSSSIEKEDSSSSEDESSSSEDESSSSAEEKVSSSSEAALPDKIATKDTVVAVGKDDVGTKVDESDLPEGLTKGDSLTGGDLYIGEGDFDFENNDYYCKTPEGEWYVLDGSKYDNFWARLWDKIVKFFTGKSWLDYSKVCEVIYVHPKF